MMRSSSIVIVSVILTVALVSVTLGFSLAPQAKPLTLAAWTQF